MQLGYVMAVIYSVSMVYSVLSGNVSQLASAAIEGAAQAVELCLSLCGMICLWSGVMELMESSGLAGKLAKLTKPLLARLFPKAAKDEKTLAALSENFSANLLGLGNAATPAGIRAALGMKDPGSDRAGRELCLLVVINTASLQLLPTTAAALRGALGASAPMDILPAVWLSSLTSVTVGILAAKLLEKGGRHGAFG